MDILQIILTIMSVIAYGVTAGFTFFVFGKLHRVQKDIKSMERSLTLVMSVTLGNHVKGCYEEINKMKMTLDRLVEDERFEETEQLRTLIDKAEANMMETVEKINSSCGEIMDITLKKVERQR